MCSIVLKTSKEGRGLSNITIEKKRLRGRIRNHFSQFYQKLSENTRSEPMWFCARIWGKSASIENKLYKRTFFFNSKMPDLSSKSFLLYEYYTGKYHQHKLKLYLLIHCFRYLGFEKRTKLKHNAT